LLPPKNKKTATGGPSCMKESKLLVVALLSTLTALLVLLAALVVLVRHG
jgi:hypothetical protein